MQILVTELGDETFIIAAIMAMRHSRLTVYAGAMSALALMTVSPIPLDMSDHAADRNDVGCWSLREQGCAVALLALCVS